MNKYLVTISDVSTDEYVAFAYGDFATMNFATKRALAAIKDATGDFSGRIVEVEAIGTEDEKRTVVSVTGDVETVAVVMKRKIARERKEQSEPETADAASDAPADALGETDV